MSPLLTVAGDDGLPGAGAHRQVVVAPLLPVAVDDGLRDAVLGRQEGLQVDYLVVLQLADAQELHQLWT